MLPPTPSGTRLRAENLQERYDRMKRESILRPSVPTESASDRYERMASSNVKSEKPIEIGAALNDVASPFE